MQEIGKFLAEHWESILSAVIFIFSFVLCLIKKKPVLNILSMVACNVYECLPDIISTAEILYKDGKQKLEYVISTVLDLCSKELGHKLSKTEHDYFYQWFIDIIEGVLSTPQKKDIELPSLYAKLNEVKK